MDCKRFEDRLNSSVDNGLSADELREFRDHLASCPHCARTLEDLKKTRAWLGSLEEVEPPPWFEQKIMQGVRREHEKRSVWQKLFQPLYIKLPVQALATAVIVVIAVQVFRAVEPEVKQTIAPAPSPAPVAEVAGKADSAAAPAEAPAAASSVRKAAPSEAGPVKKESVQQLKKETPAISPEPVGSLASPAARPAPAPAGENAVGRAAAPSAPAADHARMRESFEADKMQAYGPRMEQAAAAKGKKDEEKAAAEMKSADSIGAADAGRKKAKASRPGTALSLHYAQPVIITIKPHAPDTAMKDIGALLGQFNAANIKELPGAVTADVPAENLAELSARLSRLGEVRPASPPSPASGSIHISINIDSAAGKADEKAR
jgi:sorbitol-specific phosphotransferase system component IIA